MERKHKLRPELILILMHMNTSWLYVYACLHAHLKKIIKLTRDKNGDVKL